MDKDEPDAVDEFWGLEVLVCLQEDLQVNDKYLNAYLPLMPTDCVPSPDCIGAFVSTVSLSYAQAVEIVMRLLLCLISYGKYDGRGRALIRNLSHCFNLTASDQMLMERQLAVYMHEHEAEINTFLHRKKPKTGREKMIRYAKIGAVSLGAGAVLAVTGGLAAPAVAGALLVMGASTTAAAAVSVGTMGVLFGGTGMGLAGYKMMKRTRGVEEFAFECHSEAKGQLALVICVSGWLEGPDNQDYKRAFGVLPQDMSMQERLFRYYTVNAPGRLDGVDEEVDSYGDSPDMLYEHLTKLLGRDPRDNLSLIPRPLADAPTADSIAAVMRVIEEIDTKAHNSSFSKAMGGMGGMFRRNKDNNKQMAGSKEQETVLEEEQADRRDRKDSRDSRDGRDGATDGFAYETFSSIRSQHPTTTPVPMAPAPVYDREEVEEASSLQEEAQDELAEIVDEVTEAALSRAYWHWSELPYGSYEHYLLRWETSLQVELGASLAALARRVSSTAVQHVLAATVLTSLASAVMLPVLLLKVMDVIDNLWTIACERADAAGKELATALLTRACGSRPVTLIGYSLGARVIFAALKEIALVMASKQKKGVGVLPTRSEETLPPGAQSERVEKGPQTGFVEWEEGTEGVGEEERSSKGMRSTVGGAMGRGYAWMVGSNANSPTPAQAPEEVQDVPLSVIDTKCLVQDVILLGTPQSATSSYWPYVRQVVGGRFINGYSSRDLILSLIYRYERTNVHVAGISPIPTPGIENIDLSDLIDKHTDYGRKIKEILQRVDLSSPAENPTVVI